MTPWTSWLARLGLAGSCLVWAGCGGGDVPDPDSDSHAATGPAPGGAAAPPAVPPVVQNAPPAPAAPAPAVPGPAAMPGAPVMPGAPAALQAPGSPAPGAVAGPAGAEAGAQAEDATPAADAGGEKATDKSETPSATTEMLALANAPAPAADKPAGGDAPAGGAPAGGPGGPGMPGMPGMMRPPGMGPTAPGMIPGPQASVPGPQAAMPGPQAMMMPGPQGGGPGARIGGPGIGAMPPGPGGPLGGPGGGDAAAADFRTPQSAVTAFLNAVKAKDAERLAEATALRAPTEASPRYQKIFTSIVEQSLTPEDLDELAKKLEGMQIVGQNQAKSSGRLGIIIGKSGQQSGESLQRTITVRKEKSGWKVCDISGQREFEPLGRRRSR